MSTVRGLTGGYFSTPCPIPVSGTFLPPSPSPRGDFFLHPHPHGSPQEKVVYKREIPEDLEASVLENKRELIEVVSRVNDKLAEAFCNGRIIFGADLQLCRKQFVGSP
ncbi:elongation factor G-2, mitochondrial [Trifolium repens]|nr:elongation factor G-2, mitochondrial [Trifolium repens]